ncbi:cutinase family protein [Nocardia sp. NPDC046473]|uniref:cutinase family protein n=1 Tax=Nocardia sp. NPDC046473 TaxID=3155733 RepID=UPI0033DA375E
MHTHRSCSPRPGMPGRRDGRAPVRLTVCAAVTSLLAVTTAATIAAADPPAPGCAPFTAVLVPGTTETSPAASPGAPVGLLRPIGDGLTARYGPGIDVRYLPYTAAAAPYAASESNGTQALSTLLSQLCPTTRVVLAGYSQGADVAGDTATAIGHGSGAIDASRVSAVALISDPHRAPTTPQLGPAVGGQGIAGPRSQDFGALTNRVRTTCVSGDLYCSTSPDTSPAWSALGHVFTGSPDTVADSSELTASTPAEATSGLDAPAVTRQVVLVAGGLAQFAAGIPRLLDDLGRLPGAVLAADIPGAHQLCGEINTLVSPLVQLADKVDLHLVAQALELAAPLDSSGATAIAAQIVTILARADIARIAADIGRAQEIAWRAGEKLSLGDPLGAGIELVGGISVATDLAAAAGAALLGTTSSGTSLTSALTSDPDTSDMLGDLASQGRDAAAFYTSGVHQTGYDTTLPIVLDWITAEIDQAR